jgi:TolB protein
MTKPNFELGPDGELPDYIAEQLPPPAPLRATPRKLFRVPRSTLFTTLFSFVAICAFSTIIMRGAFSPPPIAERATFSYSTRATQTALHAAHEYFAGIPSCASRRPNTAATLVFRAGPSSGMELLRVDDNGDNLCRMTHDLRLKYDPSYAPDGDELVFSRQALDGSINLFKLNRDSSILIYLASVERLMLAADWSPDGQRLAMQTSSGLAVAPADTGEILRDDMRYLTQSDIDTAPDWSPDSQQIVFVRGSTTADGDELYTINADGTGLQRLTDNAVNEQSPHWSPDGHEMVYAADGRIYVMNADGSDVRQLAAAGYDAYDPVWSPDGQYIAFASPGQDPYTDFVLYLMDRDGYNVRPLTPPLGVADIDWR